jgi:hypothetical protein
VLGFWIVGRVAWWVRSRSFLHGRLLFAFVVSYFPVVSIHEHLLVLVLPFLYIPLNSSIGLTFLIMMTRN